MSSCMKKYEFMTENVYEEGNIIISWGNFCAQAEIFLIG